ncbi:MULTISPECIES: ABC transporter ATP-binding protein [Calothrix]|uniref:ABC transporter ATP-binding protein n=2 Tax=Calothrix TaxID=1186 RepID=A0ABR8AG53_9CYAN|nr:MULTISPECIES: ABC transporter ATP-binding protein [Calothrix]MBD2199017.1 ABC transporter ATP-binding protein [Calothrix parietina FACHB-288]MBD2227730.1 ABC transporter ATP-binding protein [Calothrix anomala FACHB-343]
MGEEIAISLKNVSKCYKRYAHPVDRLKELLLPGKTYAQEFWALTGISFEVIKGETMGIIGRNGAGKSTLLQLICKTLTPTSGELQVNGRVAALLELGAGFNPEFTGRENVYMNGAIMGLSKQEVDERFEQIAAFADIGDFIEQPVKTYSSGMYVRLAFASAIHIDPDILIVDEALAVGDMFFQAKCMARMRKMMEAGVTVLFVSHDIGAVKSMCRSCIYLEEGTIFHIGNSESVVNQYLKKTREQLESLIQPDILITAKNTQQENLEEPISEASAEIDFWQLPNTGYGSKKSILEKYRVLDSDGNKSDSFDWSEKITIQILAKFFVSAKNYSIGFLIRDIYGLDLFGTNLRYEAANLPELQINQRLLATFTFDLMLQPGTYTLTLGVSVINEDNVEDICDWQDNIYVFKINKLNNLTPETKVYIPTKTEFSIVL